jgi:hypothetical protein
LDDSALVFGATTTPFVLGCARMEARTTLPIAAAPSSMSAPFFWNRL